MFQNLNWWEMGLLLLLALLIFGDKLPNVISDGLRMVRNLRTMASNATSDLSRELGTDIKLEDLHPKAFIRKHLLSEEDEAALRKPFQAVYDDLKTDLTGVQKDFKDIGSAVDPRSSLRSGWDSASVNGSSPASAAVAGNGAGPTGPIPGQDHGGTSIPAPSVPATHRDYDLDAT